jgi:hypothetical protein
MRLPGDPSCEELSRLLNRPVNGERPRWVPPELTERLSVSSTIADDPLGLPESEPEGRRELCENPCWEEGSESWGSPTKVAFWGV